MMISCKLVLFIPVMSCRRVFKELQAELGQQSVFRLLCKQSCGCSFCGDSWPPTGTRQLPSSEGGRRWGRGRGTSPASPPPPPAVGSTGGANPPRPGSSRRCPESRGLMRRREANSHKHQRPSDVSPQRNNTDSVLTAAERIKICRIYRNTDNQCQHQEKIFTSTFRGNDCVHMSHGNKDWTSETIL